MVVQGTANYRLPSFSFWKFRVCVTSRALGRGVWGAIHCEHSGSTGCRLNLFFSRRVSNPVLAVNQRLEAGNRVQSRTSQEKASLQEGCNEKAS